jgi:anti-anti-sigma factor
VDIDGHVIVKQAGDTVVISFGSGFEVGDLAVVADILDETIAHGHTTVVVDMSTIDLVQASALFPFLKRWPDLRKRGGDIKLCGLSKRVKEALALIDVDTLPEAYATLDEALHAIPETPAPQ